MNENLDKLMENFLSYILIPTNSYSNSETIPSTHKQFVLAKYLKKN